MYRTTRDRLFSAAALAAVVAAVVVAAAGAWFASAGGVRAPEPARLNSTLSTTSVGAMYVNTLRATTAYFMSSTNWMVSSLPAGAPCSTTSGLPAGTTVYSVIQASGSYRKCG